MKNRNLTIDSIRGIAIVFVLIHHIDVQRLSFLNNPFANGMHLLLQPFFTGGWIAVDLFFVLSGFLVSGLIFNEIQNSGQFNFRKFLIRRGFKIYPGFYFFLAVSLLIGIIAYKNFDHQRPYFRGYILDGLFLHNYFGGAYGTTWSLDVEEAFYVLLTFFILILLKTQSLNKKYIIKSYIGLLVFGIIARIIANIQYPVYNFDKQFSQTHFRLDALFFGVLLSYLYQFERTRTVNWLVNLRKLIFVLSVVCLLTNFLFSREQHSWISVLMLALNPLAFGALLLLAIIKKPRILEQNRILRFLGVNSYAIYLWHPLVNYWLTNKILIMLSAQRFFLYVLSYLLLSVICGYLATRFVEKPVLRLREKYFANI